MIAQIRGKVIQKEKNSITVDVQGICYRVLIPSAIVSRIDESIQADGTIQIVTYYYLQTDPSKAHPVLIGFLNEVERDFFELFITVSGIGPRAAVKALNRPISEIAKAINDANLGVLTSLPGIGTQRAREIIAKLQNKIGKFGLIKDDAAGVSEPAAQDWQEEALQVLLQLQYKKHEAQQMIKNALARTPGINNTEDLLNEVYRQKVER